MAETNDYYPIEIHGSKFNVNREYPQVLNDFADLKPYYDEANGLHMRAGKDVFKFESPAALGQKICIPGSRDMTDVEYYTRYCELRTTPFNDLFKSILNKGYDHPSPTQAIGIPPLVNDNDMLLQAKSGTGKTCTYLIGSLFHFDPTDVTLQIIYIANTQEMAKQIYTQVCEFVTRETKVGLCVGVKKEEGGFRDGIKQNSHTSPKHKSVTEERNEFKHAQILVCTVGKLYDTWINKKIIDVTNLRAFVVDEFDIIVSQRYKSGNYHAGTDQQIRDMVERIPYETQRIFVSATVSNDAIDTAVSYFRKDSEHRKQNYFIALLDDNV